MEYEKNIYLKKKFDVYVDNQLLSWGYRGKKC